MNHAGTELPAGTVEAADLLHMRTALELARDAAQAGEVPIGCVLVRDGKILARTRNRMEEIQDATRHAEIQALSEASQVLDSWRLDGSTLYVTLEPCPMCAGAILLSRVARVVFGASDPRLGACTTHFRILSENPIHRPVEVVPGVLAEECSTLLKEFFRELRNGSRERSKQRRLDGSNRET